MLDESVTAEFWLIIEMNKVNRATKDNQAACSDANTDHAIFSCESSF